MASPSGIVTKYSDITSLERDAREFALSQGLVIRSARSENDNDVVHVPFTLCPSPIPRDLYQLCLNIHPTMSKLMHKLANDLPYMNLALKDIVGVDDFTRNLINVQQVVEKEGLAQPILSCINRSDYLLDRSKSANDKEALRIRQVEINAIASSMSSHSCLVHDMHRYLRLKYGHEQSTDETYYPKNDSLDFISNSLVQLFDLYGKSNCSILLISEPRSMNFAEHFSIEYRVHKLRPDVRFVKRRFVDLPDILKLGPNKELLLEGQTEIALVYFRYGYDPSNYEFNGAWDTRLLIEQSRAIKCPSISYHVSGIKKFQQLLCDRESLEKFLSSSEAEEISQVLCKFWPIDADSNMGNIGYQKGLSDYQDLVLKPQREGGGHNLYGLDIKNSLESMKDSNERKQYILMEKINAPTEYNWLLHSDDRTTLATRGSTNLTSPQLLISELGIYGSIISNQSDIISNSSSGYLVRSKRSGVDEGGVIAGYSGISSIRLIDTIEGPCLDQYYQI